jgi:hypothetical protein
VVKGTAGVWVSTTERSVPCWQAEQQQPEEQVYAQSFTFFSFYLLLR